MPSLKRTMKEGHALWKADAELGFLGYTCSWSKFLVLVMTSKLHPVLFRK